MLDPRHLGLELGAWIGARKQVEQIRLIPSENYASSAVLEALSTPFANKYSEGYPGENKRYYEGQEFIDQVELLAYATAEQSAEVHAELLARAEGTLRALGLAYRVLDLCAGDLGVSSARTFDLEVYAPGCDMWLEASSVSWFTDYQARRANVRYRPASGGGTSFVHTLNGSALAVPRVWAALVETCRRPDGSIEVPEALRPYMRGLEVIAAPDGSG